MVPGGAREAFSIGADATVGTVVTGPKSWCVPAFTPRRLHQPRSEFPTFAAYRATAGFSERTDLVNRVMVTNPGYPAQGSSPWGPMGEGGLMDFAVYFPTYSYNSSSKKYEYRPKTFMVNVRDDTRESGWITWAPEAMFSGSGWPGSHAVVVQANRNRMIYVKGLRTFYTTQYWSGCGSGPCGRHSTNPPASIDYREYRFVPETVVPAASVLAVTRTPTGNWPISATYSANTFVGLTPSLTVYNGAGDITSYSNNSTGNALVPLTLLP